MGGVERDLPRRPPHGDRLRPSVSARLWGWLALAALPFLQPHPASHAAERPVLYVFLATDAKAAALDKTLQQRLPALNVTVFGRFRDLDDALAKHPPDALLTLLPLLTLKGLQPAVLGVAQGRDSQEYELVSAGAPLEGALSNRLIGVVDLLGRKDTQSFVAKLLKTSDVRTKLVTKLEDLLSLLQFNAADAILIPAGLTKVLTERTRLSLFVRKLPDAYVGRAAVAVLTASVRSLVVAQFVALDAVTNEMVGVDGWSVK